MKNQTPLPTLYSIALAPELNLPNRKETLTKIESGELEAINFDAAVFSTKPNHNAYLFEGDLKNFANSFEGQSFVKDHRENLDSLLGNIQKSWKDGERFIHSIKLTTREAMTDYVEGKIRRFSISWFYEWIKCSVCQNDFTHSECQHYPGQTYRVGEEDVICQLIFVNPTGRHTAAVSVPAAEDTGILASLSAYKKEIIGNSSVAVINAPSASQPTLLKGVNIMEDENKGAATLSELTVDPKAKAIEENSSAVRSLLGEKARLDKLDEQYQASEEILIATCQHLLASGLSASHLPELTQVRIRKTFEGKAFKASELTAVIDEAKTEVAALTAGNLIQGPARGGVSGMLASKDHVKAAVDDLFQAPREPEMEGVKVHALSGIKEAYLMLTGDYNFTGGYFSELAQLSATQAYFPAITRDALNKALVKEWKEFGAAGYDWWQKIVTIEHFNNLQDVKWLRTGTIGSLPKVTEQGEYQVLPIGDTQEESSWTKYGGYIPFTIEALINDDTRAFAAFPRELAKASLRNISEQIANIFTQSSGAGPTLKDGGALFNATAVTAAGGHKNLLTTAMGTDYTAWDAIATAMYNQPMHVDSANLGTGKKQAIEPAFCLHPRALKAQAQSLFNPSWNPLIEAIPAKGGPTYAGQVEPITVPEFTDANDFAAVADPRLVPGVMIGEIFGIEPQIILAGDERDPAMFMNDEIRHKVRHFLTVGVANYRAVHKSNVV